MEIMSGRWKANDGGAHNLKLVANMLCEIVGFELPFPHVFQDEGLSLEDTAASSNTQRVQSLSLAAGSSHGPQLVSRDPLPLQLSNTQRVQSDSLAVGSSLGPCSAPLPREHTAVTRSSKLHVTVALPSRCMKFQQVCELEDAVSVIRWPSDSLAVGSTLNNSESVNRPRPSRSPSPPPRMSEQSLINAITSAHEWVRNYNTESPPSRSQWTNNDQWAETDQWIQWDQREWDEWRKTQRLDLAQYERDVDEAVARIEKQKLERALQANGNLRCDGDPPLVKEAAPRHPSPPSSNAMGKTGKGVDPKEKREETGIPVGFWLQSAFGDSSKSAFDDDGHRS